MKDAILLYSRAERYIVIVSISRYELSRYYYRKKQRYRRYRFPLSALALHTTLAVITNISFTSALECTAKAKSIEALLYSLAKASAHTLPGTWRGAAFPW